MLDEVGLSQLDRGTVRAEEHDARFEALNLEMSNEPGISGSLATGVVECPIAFHATSPFSEEM